MTDVYPMVERNKIYVVRSGSYSYGLNTPESDVDIRGVFIPDKEYLLGNKRIEQYGPTSDDQVYYALAKFIHLATNCNPNIIELLYVQDKDILFSNDFGRKLRENRELFLSKKANHTFLGYSHAQISRMENHRKWLVNPVSEPNRDDYWTIKGVVTREGKVQHEVFDEKAYRGDVREYNSYKTWRKNRNKKRKIMEDLVGYDVKFGYHLLRLMYEGLEVLDEGTITLPRPERELLKRIRDGKISYEEIMERFKKKEKQMEESYKTSELPHSPDFDKIDNLLIELHEEFLYQK